MHKPEELEVVLERVKKYAEVRAKREALKQGISVEEYLKAEESKAIKDASETLDISAEQVVAQEWHKKPRFYIAAEARARKLTREQNKLVTAQDILDEDIKRLRESTWPNTECIEPWELGEYEKTGTLPANRLEHLKSCLPCYAMATAHRDSYLTFNAPAGPECLTKEELHEVHEGRKIDPARKQHTESCKRCKMHFYKYFEMYLDKVLPWPT